jgi:hypothetical protein
MHPADVAAFIETCVAELHEQVAARPDLGVQAIERNDVELSVTFETSTSATAAQVLDVGAVAPQGGVAAATGGMEVPIIGTQRRERFVLQMDLTDWDSQPPTAVLCDESGNVLPNGRWPHDRGSRGIVEGHPEFGDRKFFCRPGTREFHSHPQHEDTPWDAIREGTTLHGIITGLLFDLTHRWTFRSTSV